ncbi:DUF5800 family protein [Halorutilales archaeon Cl-col2-1]
MSDSGSEDSDNNSDKSEVVHSGTVLRFDRDGVDVEYDGHEFRMRKEVVEGASGKDYLETTDLEVVGMIDTDIKSTKPATKIKDLV